MAACVAAAAVGGRAWRGRSGTPLANRARWLPVATGDQTHQRRAASFWAQEDPAQRPKLGTYTVPNSDEAWPYLPNAVKYESFAACNVGYVRGHSRVLRGINFSLHAGSALLLRGPNGSGKTTLLRLAAGFGTPTEGGFLVNGMAVEPKRHNDAISGQVQLVAARNDGLKPVLTVHENLSYWTGLYGGTGESLERAYAQLDVGYLRDRQVRTLSTGQRRILSIARIVAAPCALWLLDEPTIALDTTYALLE